MFENKLHYERVSDLLRRLGTQEPGDELLALIYLIGGEDNLYTHAQDLIDFDKKTVIMKDWSNYSWLTGSSRSLAFLAYDLFTGEGLYPANDGALPIDPVNILKGLPEHTYALAVNAIHLRFHKTEFITFTYDPNERYD